jgi:hypothetical protein
MSYYNYHWSQSNGWHLAFSCWDSLHYCMVFFFLWANILKLPPKIVLIKKSRVEGFSLNYFAFSFTGYTYYTIYLTLGRFSNLKGAGTVVIADLIFIYHTVFMIIIQLIQCIIYHVYWTSHRKGQINSPIILLS